VVGENACIKQSAHKASWNVVCGSPVTAMRAVQLLFKFICSRCGLRPTWYRTWVDMARWNRQVAQLYSIRLFNWFAGASGV